MTILDVILEIGDLEMLYLIKDRLSSIISEKGMTVGLACEFHIKINEEKLLWTVILNFASYVPAMGTRL